MQLNTCRMCLLWSHYTVREWYKRTSFLQFLLATSRTPLTITNSLRINQSVLSIRLLLLLCWCPSTHYSRSLSSHWNCLLGLMSVCCGGVTSYLLRLPLFIVLLIIIVLIIAPGYYLRNVCTTNSLTLRYPVPGGINPSGVRLLHCSRYSLAALCNPCECPVFVAADLHKKGLKTV